MRIRNFALALVLPSLACGGGDGGGITDSSAPRTPLVSDFSVTPEGKAIAGVTPLKFVGASGATTYTWDFGDGSTATGAEVTKTFQAAGSFRVGLTVADGRGGSAAGSRTIEVFKLDGYWSDRVGGLGNYGVFVEQRGATLTGELVTWRHGCRPATIRGSIEGRTFSYSGTDECGHVDRFEGTIDEAGTVIQGDLRFTETDGITRGYEIHFRREP
jgi:PKD repeat protein